MKKPRSFYFIFSLCLLPFSLSASPWKLTALDFYYSGYVVKAASGFNTYIYHDMSKKFAADNPGKAGFDPSWLKIHHIQPNLYRNSFHADLVLAGYFSSRILQSQELRMGLSYSYVSNHSLVVNYAGELSFTRNDTAFYYYTNYKYAEKALSLNLSYLLNFRLTNTVAVYGGGHIMLDPFQTMEVPYVYQNRVTKMITPDSGKVLRTYYDGNGPAANYHARSSFSAGYIIGLKFNIDCQWNMFLEYQWLYRRMAFKDDITITSRGSGFQAGFRYKFGRVPDDDDDKEEKENPLFW